ncbi:hypothetical protein HYV57_01865 [Candidatus Peregrinibacteria bacterium]|nr:hypothetical protein [Candidatus Peregrinibacteria bacterium]
MTHKLEKALKWIVCIFQKNEVPFQITGGFAAHIYGAKRQVNDIDIDIPENMMKFLIPDIQEYVTFGPGRYKDERWNLKLITLNYKTQEIDIGGAFETKIFDDMNNQWKHIPAHFEMCQIHTIFGMRIPVISPEELIAYKKLLSGEHQKGDIEAVKQYMYENCNLQ